MNLVRALLVVLSVSFAAPIFGAPLRSPGEFEKSREVLLGTADSYLASPLYQGIAGAVAREVDVSIFVDGRAVAQELQYDLVAAGVDLARVTFYTTPVDTIWMRDYGPFVLKDGSGDPMVVDVRYYYGRFNDDKIPKAFAKLRGWAYKPASIELEGGNYMSDGKGTVVCSERIYKEQNDDLDQSEVDGQLKDLLGADRVLVVERMKEEGTGHIDMFSKFMDEKTVLVGRYPQSDINYALLERNAKRYEQAGYKVVRIPMPPHDDGVFRTYTNSLFAAGKAMVPQFGLPTDAEALATYKKLGWDAVGVDCRTIIEYGGAIHCVSMQVAE